jgi:DNA-binding PadR family transcriptional regulator
MPDVKQQQLISANQAAMLGALSWGESSGYDLERKIRRSVGMFWSSAKSHVYVTLGRLVEDGLATVRDVEQTGRPDKQLYRITTEGELALDRWLAEAPLEPARFRNAFLLKIFFGSRMDLETLVRHIEEGRADVEEELVQLEAMAKDDDRDPFRRLVLSYGLEVDRARIRWADEALRSLRGGKR